MAPPSSGEVLVAPEAPIPITQDGDSTAVDAAAAAAADANGGQRWYTLVEGLAGSRDSTPQAVEDLLRRAVAAARSDFQWADSGITPLLQRAQEAAKAGFVDTASKTALGALDFARVVDKYKQALSSGTGSEGKARSNSSASSEDDVAAGRSKRQRCQHDQEEAEDAACSAQQQAGTPRRRGEPQATWTGLVKVKPPGGSTAEFCRLSMQVPEQVLTGLPKELVVSSIQPRKAVARMAGVACSTCITAAGPQQVAELRQMAQLELVALVQLEDCGAILVPYFTDAGALKAVTFLAAME